MPVPLDRPRNRRDQGVRVRNEPLRRRLHGRHRRRPDERHRRWLRPHVDGEGRRDVPHRGRQPVQPARRRSVHARASSRSRRCPTSCWPSRSRLSASTGEVKLKETTGAEDLYYMTCDVDGKGGSHGTCYDVGAALPLELDRHRAAHAHGPGPRRLRQRRPDAADPHVDRGRHAARHRHHRRRAVHHGRRRHRHLHQHGSRRHVPARAPRRSLHPCAPRRTRSAGTPPSSRLRGPRVRHRRQRRRHRTTASWLATPKQPLIPALGPRRRSRPPSRPPPAVPARPAAPCALVVEAPAATVRRTGLKRGLTPAGPQRLPGRGHPLPAWPDDRPLAGRGGHRAPGPAQARRRAARLNARRRHASARSPGASRPLAPRVR